MRLRNLVVILLSASFFLAKPSIAEEKPKAYEALPPHLAARVDRRSRNLSPLNAAGAVVSSLKLWQPERFPITVCFFGGSPDLRVRIMNAALEWTRHGANIPLDFGNPSEPRTCDNRGSDIKIGFAYAGYWSTVGQDSRDLVPAYEQSMNFENWDIVPAPEPEFTSTVLHEFGHAIGYQHEHQHPFSECDFDWPAIYNHLAKPPNNWPREKVDYNMRALHSEDVDATEFDPESIMLYTFESLFYESGENSKCFHPPNFALSDKDIEFAKKNYPVDPSIARENRRSTVAALTRALTTSPDVSNDERIRAFQEIEVLSSPNLEEPRRRATINLLQAPSRN